MGPAPICFIQLARFPLGQTLGVKMTIDERAGVNMAVVLEETCHGLSHGRRECRQHIAEKLWQSAKKGNVTLEGLRRAGRRALAEFAKPKVP